MISDRLEDNEKILLLKLARQSIEHSVKGIAPPEIDLNEYSSRLREDGASFVTLTKKGALRGCIGTLEAYQPLVQDVCEHAVAAAMSDYRFPQVSAGEMNSIEIEVSRLTEAQKIDYQEPLELLSKIRPHIDGVIFRDGFYKATFLPQVWEKIPEPEFFFSQLCQKMGCPADLWKKKILEVFIYQVEEFSEKQLLGKG